MNLPELFGNLAPGAVVRIAGAGFREGIPARDADAGWTLGVGRRPDGDLIVVDYQWHRLYRIDGDGILHNFAGDGIRGLSGDGGPAEAARFNNPHDLAIDRQGNLYLSDLGNQVYRRIDAETGIVTRVAGSGKVGRGGDGGPAVDAEMDTTCGIAVAANGDLYLSSEWADNVRRVDARTGIIERFAGLDARHYPSERGNSRPGGGPGISLGGYHGDGGPAAEAGFHHPEHLAFDSQEDLYVCDNSNDRIRRIDMKTGVVTTVLGNGQRASNGDGGPAVEASTLMPDAICFDAGDNLYVGEKYGFRIRKVEAATGIVTTLVGNGCPGFGEEGLPGTETHCNSVEAGIWADADGSVYWGDCSGRTRRCDGATGIVTTVLGGTHVHDGEAATEGYINGIAGIDVAPDGRIYLADAWNQRIRVVEPATGIIGTVAGNGARAYGGDNGPATEAYLGNPHDVSVDPEGRVVIADTRHSHVRRVAPDGIIRVVAGTGQEWDKGDGALAVSACFVQVASVAHGPNGDLYIGDAVGRIRRVDADSGIITTVAGIGLPGYSGDGGAAAKARIHQPEALCFGPDGALFFADSRRHAIRKVDADGVIDTVAGCGESGFSPDGTRATEARIDGPSGVAVGIEGSLYFSDTNNHCVRRVGADGRLQTVAGFGGEPGECADGERGTAARLNEPNALCFFDSHILLISDFGNNRVRALRLPD